jgi:homocysteine S-methyltransferase
MERGRTARGVEAVEAVAPLAALGADVFGTNCGKGPREVIEAIENLVRSGVPETAGAGGTAPIPLSAFPNAGYPEYVNGRYIYLTTPEYMADSARRLVEAGVTLVGGCCGTSPRDIAAIAAAVKGVKAVPLAAARARLLAECPAPPVEALEAGAGADADAAGVGGGSGAIRIERPGLKPKAKRPRPEVAFSVAPLEATPREPGEIEFLKPRRDGRPPIMVEIDPPKDLDIERALKAAKTLARAGVDAITVGDNPLAIMRMSNLAFGYLVQREAQVRVIAHLSCRDRNLIGTQSELMGAHALGIRAILAVTGDPASIGNQPGATSVYDMNSFGLVELMARMNRGENLIGEPLGRRTAFTIGSAFNPNGRRIDDQLRRLARKVEMGAHFVQTQPCYNPARIREMYERAAGLVGTRIPIFLGVLPLLSYRSAEYLHNEVPGIEIPETVRRRLEGLDKDAARAEGLAITKEIIEEVAPVAHGYYIIPPFNASRNATELVEFIKARAARTRAPAP